MGRAPCCDKANVKKGPWSPEEDEKLKSYIEKNGTGGNWIALPQKIGLKRCGKSCRLRWLNYLRPNLKHGGFSEEEDNIICNLYISIGSRWSIIAAQLPGRTDNDIKNYWNTRLKKKLLGKQRKEQQARRVNCLKQEIMKKGSHDQKNFMVVNNVMAQNSYWPQSMLPASVPYNQNQDPRLLNDQASIRKLLIKLGGRFSDNDHDQEPNDTMKIVEQPLDIPSTTTNQFYDSTINSHSSSASIDSLNNPYTQLLNNPYDIEGASMQILQGLENFQFELDEMVYSNPPRLEGLECYNGAGLANGSSISTWDNMGSFPYPPTVSNYEYPPQQEIIQECAFEEGPRYLGLP
ncbi:hypothetical protein GIB67_020059 [Kingdonia uniflora]|uniref:Uncharacterized protein n=1 Tax=Kingdonia uniflora TaxID=39325 RepID=A0A7J7L2E7_9MAGN|nr:hypothetical protein GIB67_020059 [Kingdonia uniflora]